MKAKCVFLDRDGVINHDPGTYTFEVEKFDIIEGVPEAIAKFKEAGYFVVIITNQAGIAKGLYTEEAVMACHQKLQEACGNLVDDIYFSPYHQTITNSLTRKPGSLMFEKAIAKYSIDPAQSWMVGDSERDMTPAIKLGIKTVRIAPEGTEANHLCQSLSEATERFIWG